VEDRLPCRLVAILYADVASYSRLTGENGDATHRTLSRYLDAVAAIIESHRGEVVHYAGDAVLARFDAVLGALSSAVAIQSEIGRRNVAVLENERVQFRIGVNLGDVIHKPYCRVLSDRCQILDKALGSAATPGARVEAQAGGRSANCGSESEITYQSALEST